MSRSAPGEFEQLVLLAILRLADRAYGVPIVEEIRRRTERSVKRGAVYVVLRRLLAKKLVVARMGDPTPERGGRARRYFTVTPAGLAALAESRRALLRMWDGLQPLLDGMEV